MKSTVNVIVNKGLQSLIPSNELAREASGGLASFLSSDREINLPSLINLATHVVQLNNEGVFDSSSSLEDWSSFFMDDDPEVKDFPEIVEKSKGFITKNFGINFLISLAISLLPSSGVAKMLKAVFSILRSNDQNNEDISDVVLEYLKPVLISKLSPDIAGVLANFSSTLISK